MKRENESKRKREEWMARWTMKRQTLESLGLKSQSVWSPNGTGLHAVILFSSGCQAKKHAPLHEHHTISGETSFRVLEGEKEQTSGVFEEKVNQEKSGHETETQHPQHQVSRQTVRQTAVCSDCA